MKKQFTVASVLILLILVIDQILKIWIKTNMQLHESIRMTDWFYIYFTENNGMAFGMELFDKIYLTLFRIVAVSFIGYYLVKMIKSQKCTLFFIVSFSMILAGAIGNIIDSVFYGVIFDHSNGQLATLFPPSGGYETWFHGKVVDMFYFPLIESTFPEWLPIWGGEDFIFFRPIFNVADAAISVGVFFLFVFFRHTFVSSTTPSSTEANEKPVS